MELLNKKIEKSLPELYSQEHVADPVCNLKFFTPDSSFTWYVLEGAKQEDGDWLFFTKAVSHFCPEGAISLLEGMRTIFAQSPQYEQK